MEEENKYLERAKEIYPLCDAKEKALLEDIFHELKDTKEEKIRQALIDLVNNCNQSTTIDGAVEKSDVIDWIKRKREYQPIFSVGDTMRTLEEARKGITDGLPFVISVDSEYYHCNNELISISNQYDYEFPPMNRMRLVKHPDLVAQLKEHLANTPKEQLEKEWKELEPWGNIGPTVQEFLYGKTAKWSEEDEEILDRFLGWLQGTMGEKTYSSWLKSLPERFNLQPKQEWSKEDRKTLDGAIFWLKKHFDKHTIDIDTENSPMSLKTALTRIESLRPQPHWKPSEEQMEALKNAAYGISINGDGPMLRSLYDDLKKLM